MYFNLFRWHCWKMVRRASPMGEPWGWSLCQNNPSSPWFSLWLVKKLSYWKLFKAQSKDNQIFFNFRENGELPPLLTVRCHHGEIKLKEVTPVRRPIIQYYVTSSEIRFDDTIFYFQPSDPPIDFDSDDEDDEDEDYWWRENCVVFQWLNCLVEKYSSFAPTVAAKPIVISKLKCWKSDQSPVCQRNPIFVSAVN